MNGAEAFTKQGAELLAQSSGCSVWKFRNETGDGTMTCYELFDGVQLFYNDFHMEYVDSGYVPQNGVLVADHCSEGRMEYEYAENTFSYFEAHDFISALPQGYDTVIGEGGGTLSGGEKQRISIARAILKNAPIIILDEAIASIDPENEHLIQSAISELTKGKTIITIAHRLATIEHADQILVVDDGRIAEKGTHSELISQDGVYKRFIQIREQAEGWRIGSV